MSDTFDVIMAGYPSVEAAQQGLRSAGRAGQGQEGQHRGRHPRRARRRRRGQASSQTGDHLGRKGLGWGGGVGVLVGLFAPPLLGVGRRRRSRRRRHRQVHQAQGRERASRSNLGEKLTPARPPSSPSFDDDDRLAAERRSPARRPSRSRRWTRKGSRGLKDALAEAAGQVRARPHACCRSPTRPSAARPAARCSDSVADWSMIPGPKAPEGAPNVLARPHRRRRLRRARHLRRPGQHAELHARAGDGPDLQPLPRDGGLLADARRAAHRAQPAPRRLRLDRRVPRPVPRLHRRQAAELRRPSRASSRRTATSPAASASGT